MKRIFFILFITLASYIYPQTDLNIVEYLIEIENGMGEDVKNNLPEMKKKFPGAPSLLYLEGILTSDGEDAVKLYTALTDKFPRSTYADAANYRLYSYYSALNDQVLADKYAGRLRSEHPSSPYTRLIPALVKEKIVEKEEIYYTIQTGAFSNVTNAETLRKKFEKAGYYTVVTDKMAGGTLFKVVYTGKFRTIAEAESFQLILNKKYGLKGIVTRLP
jgi:hypothetical protein